MKICRPLRFVWFIFEINFNVLMSELLVFHRDGNVSFSHVLKVKDELTKFHNVLFTKKNSISFIDKHLTQILCS